MEKLFSDDDLNKIQREAEHHYTRHWKATRYFQFWDCLPEEVIMVTPRCELILTKGNRHTGFDHIVSRHLFWSTQLFKNVQETSFDNPSRFGKNITYQDIPQICDIVFLNGFLVPENNKRPDLFDVFEGVYKDEKFRLILYSNTKVINTLIPLTNHSDNIKRIDKFKFIRGEVTVKTDLRNRFREIFIPYLDLELNVKYTVHITKNRLTNIESWDIAIMDDNETSTVQFHFGEKELIWLQFEKSEKLGFQHQDLRQIESAIKNLDNAIKTGRVNLSKIKEAQQNQ